MDATKALACVHFDIIIEKNVYSDKTKQSNDVK